MHAASFPPPPPPPASLTRICARPLLPPLREPERRKPRRQRPAPAPPARALPPQAPGAAGCGVLVVGEDSRPAARPRGGSRARYLSSRARSSGGAESGRRRGRGRGARRGGARRHAPRPTARSPRRGEGDQRGQGVGRGPQTPPQPMGSPRACTCRGARRRRPLWHTPGGPGDPLPGAGQRSPPGLRASPGAGRGLRAESSAPSARLGAGESSA